MYQNMCFTNLVFSMRSLRGRFVATIFVIRFFPQKIIGKLIGKMFGKLIGKFGWKICWKMLGGNLAGKFG